MRSFRDVLITLRLTYLLQRIFLSLDLLVPCIQRVVCALSAFCVLTDGMQDPFILGDDQISTSDKSGSGSFRSVPSEAPFTTADDVLNVTIKLTNIDFPSPPQIGKIDLLEHDSTNVGSYEVYYRQPAETSYSPFNSDSFLSSVEVFNVTKNILFPDSTFATHILIVIHKAASSPPGADMTIKFRLFACFESGELLSFVCVVMLFYRYYCSTIPVFLCDYCFFFSFAIQFLDVAGLTDLLMNRSSAVRSAI